jgi:subtilase family serine protease
VATKHEEPPPAELPDLVAQLQPNGSVCVRGPETKAGSLYVRVVNQGAAPSPSFSTHVVTARRGDFDRPGLDAVRTIPSLAVGQSANVGPVPFCVADTLCTLSVEVDSSQEVPESNEQNNRITGQCF